MWKKIFQVSIKTNRLDKKLNNKQGIKNQKNQKRNEFLIIYIHE
jgi:hypothetical protein